MYGRGSSLLTRIYNSYWNSPLTETFLIITATSIFTLKSLGCVNACQYESENYRLLNPQWVSSDAIIQWIEVCLRREMKTIKTEKNCLLSHWCIFIWTLVTGKKHLYCLHTEGWKRNGSKCYWIKKQIKLYSIHHQL